jgi:uncharacterized protein YbaR (Trm112 family)
MKLVTHNILSCNVKNCTDRFPLELRVTRAVIASNSHLAKAHKSAGNMEEDSSNKKGEYKLGSEDEDEDEDDDDDGPTESLVKHVAERMDKDALLPASASIASHFRSLSSLSPVEKTVVESLDALASMHDFPNNNAGWDHVKNALFGVEVMEGSLVCKGCGREFVIRNSIPNMVLGEAEI